MKTQEIQNFFSQVLSFVCIAPFLQMDSVLKF